jgi:hypothetical protein
MASVVAVRSGAAPRGWDPAARVVSPLERLQPLLARAQVPELQWEAASRREVERQESAEPLPARAPKVKRHHPTPQSTD